MRFAQTVTIFIFSLAACLLSSDTTTGRLSFHQLTSPIFTVFVLSWLTSLLPQVPRKITQIIVGEIVILLCVVDCYCQINFRSALSPQLLSVVLNTDAREAGEFLSTFLGVGIFKQWRMVLLILLFIIFPIVFVPKIEAIFAKRLIHNRYFKISFFVIVFISLIFEIKPTCDFIKIFNSECKIQDVENRLLSHDDTKNTSIHRVVFAFRANKLTELDLDVVKQCTMTANVDSCTHLSPHIVLVIGESYNKHHSSLYGYPLETAPLQRKRLENGELFLFNDVITHWNITSNAFIEIFSRPLFPVLFRRAGYHVTFFSNQFVFKRFGRKNANQSGNHFLTNKILSDSIFDYRNSKTGRYDMDLVRRFETYKSKTASEPYTFDIIHLIGQHFEYKERYPKKEAHFTENEYVNRELNDDEKQIVMHYDNATFYNDRVLDSIIRLFEREEAVVIFISDHGEEVYDDKHVQGRLFQKPDFSIARQEYEVPMWIWCSESYKHTHNEVVEQIRESVDRPFMTDDVSQLLYYLAGIDCEWYDSSRNILSVDYKCESRLINGNVDYDELH